MIVNGIIAEYNPFHTGHAYQLAEAKQSTNADYTIVIMSGNYVQRGTPALVDKYLRTRMALKGGADLVLELPAYCSTASAEYFAHGAVSLLNRLGVVDHLCFGSECADPSVLQNTADILFSEPPVFRDKLKSALAEGLSFPAARELALKAVEQGAVDYSFLSSPNNVLAIEYLKALKQLNSKMAPHLTLRLGSGYSDAALRGEYVSAMALRSELLKPDTFSDLSFQEAKPALKEYTDLPLLLEYRSSRSFLCETDFSQALFLRLLEETPESLTGFLDVSSGLANRIYALLPEYRNYKQFCELLKTKDLTYSRIARSLMHILLQIPSYRPGDREFSPGYIRLLGFRKDAAPLLSEIGRRSDLLLLSKPADAKEKLSRKDQTLFTMQLKADRLYYQSAVSVTDALPVNEYTAPIIIL